MQIPTVENQKNAEAGSIAAEHLENPSDQNVDIIANCIFFLNTAYHHKNTIPRMQKIRGENIKIWGCFLCYVEDPIQLKQG